MKLHNYTVLYLSGTMFLVLSVWAGIFYVNMLDEIHDSIDDGLENTKLLVIKKTIHDSSLLYKDDFFESNYRIREVLPDESISFKDRYSDTVLYTENEKDFEPFRMLTTIFKMPNNKYYKLRIISSTVEEDDLMEDLFYSLLTLYVILVASMILINNFLLRRIWKSFYIIIDKLKGYKIAEHKRVEFGNTNVDEFKLLQNTLNELIQTNQEIFESQKQFIENTAHELQTPLAISINKLELMAEKNNFSEEQLQQISEVIDSLERLTRLNKSLLLLSKIENKQFPETEEVVINSSVQKLVTDFSEWSEFKNIRLNIIEKDTFILQMNKTLVDILFSNLLKNAIFHNNRKGIVNIIINKNSFTIENSGTTELDVNKIFKRFQKESTNARSTGLGLPIVYSIAERYRLNISYKFSVGCHQFKVEK